MTVMNSWETYEKQTLHDVLERVEWRVLNPRELTELHAYLQGRHTIKSIKTMLSRIRVEQGHAIRPGRIKVKGQPTLPAVRKSVEIVPKQLAFEEIRKTSSALEMAVDDVVMRVSRVLKPVLIDEVKTLLHGSDPAREKHFENLYNELKARVDKLLNLGDI